MSKVVPRPPPIEEQNHRNQLIDNFMFFLTKITFFDNNPGEQEPSTWIIENPCPFKSVTISYKTYHTRGGFDEYSNDYIGGYWRVVPTMWTIIDNNDITKTFHDSDILEQYVRTEARGFIGFDCSTRNFSSRTSS